MKYQTIVADPPWPYEARMRGALLGADARPSTMKPAPMPYATMSVSQIKALDIPAASDAHLYLWTTQRFLRQAYEVVDAWDFKVGAVLVWSKPPKGVVGTFVCSTEFCLFARRGSLPHKQRHIGTCFEWSRGEHSAKPEAFLDLVESVSPGPYLEMFSRRARLGWDTWGDQALHGTELVA